MSQVNPAIAFSQNEIGQVIRLLVHYLDTLGRILYSSVEVKGDLFINA